ncbi:LOW QUALITY PROTEIN: uncharacterized protein RCH25_008126 [Pelodytes ibericus]
MRRPRLTILQRRSRTGIEARRAKTGGDSTRRAQESTNGGTGEQNGASKNGSDDLSTHNSPDPTVNVCQKFSSYTINVPKEVTGLKGHCVYIPCTFGIPENKTLSAKATGLWYKVDSVLTQNIVASKTDLGNTRERFLLAGDVNKGDCSLSISDLQYSDESQYMFRIEDGSLKYNYMEVQPKVNVRGVKHDPIAGFSIRAPREVRVQRGLCVNIPCSFSIPAKNTLSGNARGLWHKGSSFAIHSPVASKFGSEDNLGGRFSLTGDMSKGDCSFSINDVQASDESTYRFRIEDKVTKFNYLDIQPLVQVIDLTDKPIIFPMTKLVAGKEATVTCVSPGRCAGSAPKITWEGTEDLQSARTQVNRMDHEDGNRTYYSHITFHPFTENNNTLLRCTVTYTNNGPSTSASIFLNIEYVPENLGPEEGIPYNYGHIYIIAGIVVGTILVLILLCIGLLCCIKSLNKSKLKDNDCESVPGYSITAPGEVTVQEGLCVHIPCTFTIDPRYTLSANAKGLWFRGPISSGGPLVASKSGSGSNTGGRFILTGDVSKGDCSLSISDVRKSDESRYRFKIEDVVKFNYVDVQPGVTVTDLTDKPVISPTSSLVAGKEVTLTCMSPGRCAEFNLRFTWDRTRELQNVSIQDYTVDYGDSNRTFHSNITFTPTSDNNKSSLTCTVTNSNSGSSTSADITLNVQYPTGNPPIASDFTNECERMDIIFIVGIVVGNIIVLILMGLGQLYYIKRTKQTKEGNRSNGLELKAEGKESNYQNIQLASEKDPVDSEPNSFYTISEKGAAVREPPFFKMDAHNCR